MCSQNSESKINEPDLTLLENIYPESTIIISTHGDWTKSHYPKRIDEFKKNPFHL